MNESLTVSCPYCGESLIFEPEPSAETVEYVEDCHVCCQPIVLTITYSEAGSEISARREND